MKRKEIHPLLHKPDFAYLFALTEKITPLHQDCGLLCGSICCKPQKNADLGMYLFPGEEVMYNGQEPWLSYEKHDPKQYEFPKNWHDPVYFVQCTPPCPRQSRPLSCRLFPVAPHLLQNDQLILIYETLSLPYCCPLIEQKIALRKDFITTAALVWQELLLDEKIYTLVKEDSQEREQSSLQQVQVLWPFP